MACCDPAVGLLAAELARTADVRLIALQRPSRTSLSLLGEGLVHVAGVHLTTADQPGGNATVVRSELGSGYSLLRVARWEEGIAFAPGRRLSSVRAAIRSDLCWIGREDGSGARQCLDELLGSRRATPRCVATDHRGVAEAIRSGWADAGVCLRLVSEEAGLDFLGVRQEAYDLCFPARWEKDPRIQALLDVVRSAAYRRALERVAGLRQRGNRRITACDLMCADREGLDHEQRSNDLVSLASDNLFRCHRCSSARSSADSRALCSAWGARSLGRPN